MARPPRPAREAPCCPRIQAPLGLAIFEVLASLPHHVLPPTGLCCPVTSQLVLSPALWPLFKSLCCPGHSQPQVLPAGASTCGSDTPLCALSIAFAGPTQCPKALQGISYGCLRLLPFSRVMRHAQCPEKTGTQDVLCLGPSSPL